MPDKLPQVILYTDGACSGNPGPGGWAALLQWNQKEKVLTGGAPQTTNNRMEMRAVIEGLRALRRPCIVAIHSDSALIINAFQKGWIENWLQKGWKKSNKKPVENRDLWEEMLRELKRHQVKWVKVKGHADDERNNRVDKLAVDASKAFK
ncbi:MAG: ribonuclease HI [Bacteroidetes bacterium]|jgi:ribonuclease HI|nr:ribonuclease HI [Bacteroidota bacterium]